MTFANYFKCFVINFNKKKGEMNSPFDRLAKKILLLGVSFSVSRYHFATCYLLVAVSCCIRWNGNRKLFLVRRREDGHRRLCCCFFLLFRQIKFFLRRPERMALGHLEWPALFLVAIDLDWQFLALLDL